MHNEKPAHRSRVGADLFRPVAGGRISEVIAEQIRALIGDGSLKPGDRLPAERDLAERFGVSRVSVRDALRVLEVLGLIEIRVGAAGGAFVTVPSSEIFGQSLQNLVMTTLTTPEDVAETRLVLELGIVTVACERATPTDLQELRAICEHGERALADGTYRRDLSEAFHARLGEATHNLALALVSKSFRGPLSMFELRARERDDEDERHARSLADHIAILDALEQRRPIAARRAIAEHLTFDLDSDRCNELLKAFGAA